MSNAIVQVGPAEKQPGGRQLLRATLGGSMTSDDVPLVTGWAKGVADGVKSLANDEKESVCVLIDISTMGTYSDPTVITVITDLMKEDGALVYKTATYGGTVLHEMIEGVLRSMSGRTNLQNFKTEAQALTWLKS